MSFHDYVFKKFLFLDIKIDCGECASVDFRCFLRSVGNGLRRERTDKERV